MEHEEARDTANYPTKDIVHDVLLGELAGTIISVGAVYLGRGIFSRPVNQAQVKLEHYLGQKSDAARKIMDVSLMNAGEIGNIGLQTFLRKNQNKKNEDTPLSKEDMIQISIGWGSGLIGGSALLALMEATYPQFIRSAERALVKTGINSYMAELLASSCLQGVGGALLNGAAQIAYKMQDDRKNKRIEASAKQKS